MARRRKASSMGAAVGVFAMVLLAGVDALPPVKLKPAKGISTSVESPLVLDVDAGVDDAVAILVALGHERNASVSRVAGITCAHGNTNLPNVLNNVFHILHVAKRMDVPVYAGARRSLLKTPPSDNYFGSDGFGDIGVDSAQYQGKAQRQHAVNALIDMVTRRPGEVTLLCLGPLTNIALAVRMQEEFISLAKELVVLGGSVEGHGNVQPGVEFNAYMDPEALKIVLDAAQEARKPLLIIPWETILKRVRLPLEWRKGVLGTVNSEAMQLLNRAEARHLGATTATHPPTADDVMAGSGPAVGAEDAKGESWWPAADAIATAIALDPSLVKTITQPLFIQVDVGYGPGRATQQVDYGNISGQAPNARIVVDVDKEALKQMLLKNLS